MNKRKYCALFYVAGHSRGGTTWLGSLLKLHPDVQYVFEPFASQAHAFTGFDTQTIFNNHRTYVENKLEPKTEYISPHFFNMSSDIPELEPYRLPLQMHQERLIERMLKDVSNKYVVFKQPRMENLGWALSVIQPDRAVVINRSPFGIINSYHKGNFWSWMRYEFPLAAKTVPIDYPEFAALFEGDHTPAEKLLIMSYIRTKVVEKYCKAHNIKMILYKELCYDTPGVMSEVSQHLGLPFTDEYQAIIHKQAVPEQVSEGWLDTNKIPFDRAQAWRYELPPDVIETLSRFIDRHQLDIPYPGHGLPALSPEEIRAGVRYNRHKKWTELRDTWTHYTKRVVRRVLK